jgi:hypothetical protein
MVASPYPCLIPAPPMPATSPAPAANSSPLCPVWTWWSRARPAAAASGPSRSTCGGLAGPYCRTRSPNGHPHPRRQGRRRPHAIEGSPKMRDCSPSRARVLTMLRSPRRSGRRVQWDCSGDLENRPSQRREGRFSHWEGPQADARSRFVKKTSSPLKNHENYVDSALNWCILPLP